MDKTEVVVEHETADGDESLLSEDDHHGTPKEWRKLTMVYLLFLAEAIMASSLAAQVVVLSHAAEECMTVDVSFLRGTLECAYFLGSTSGVFWGWTADRIGRRKLAIVGTSGMGLCCIAMGFAKTFAASVALRFTAGTISSSVSVAALAMLADLTHGTDDRTDVVSRIPVTTACGSIGPLAAHVIQRLDRGNLSGPFKQFPGLRGQIICAAMVIVITLAEYLLLEETLPTRKTKNIEAEAFHDCEKATFLGQSYTNESDDSSISIIEALNSNAASPLPSQITVTQMLVAPSVLVLLASFAILSLHSSTFDLLLPQLGHTDSHEAGMGIACDWLPLVVVIVQAFAGLRVVKLIPEMVRKIGLLPMYRRISLSFPLLYTAVPLVGILTALVDIPTIVSAFISVATLLLKTVLADAAQVLMLLLVLAAAPDATSTGTTIGIVSVAQLFKALAVGITGTSYYLSNDYSIVAVNGSLWASLIVVALVGCFLTWKLRETPRVGADIPESCLTWQGVFDVESDEEGKL